MLGADLVRCAGDVPALAATVGSALGPGGTLRVMSRAGRGGLPELVAALAGLGQVRAAPAELSFPLSLSIHLCPFLSVRLP